MKYISILLLIVFSCTTTINTAQVFVRIYNHHHKKIGKGIIETVSDSSIVLLNDDKNLDSFLITQVSYIKTKRSLGTSIGLGCATGVFIPALILFVLKDSDVEIGDKGWKIIGIGIISAIATGTIAGTVSGLSTKRQKFIINGDIEKWKVVSKRLLALPANDIMLTGRNGQ
jgi:hypothetical protein